MQFGNRMYVLRNKQKKTIHLLCSVLHLDFFVCVVKLCYNLLPFILNKSLSRKQMQPFRKNVFKKFFIYIMLECLEFTFHKVKYLFSGKWGGVEFLAFLSSLGKACDQRLLVINLPSVRSYLNW